MVEIEKQARDYVKNLYNLMSDDEKRDSLVLDSEDKIPEFDSLNFNQICDILGVEYARHVCSDVIDVLLKKEFAEKYLHIHADIFFRDIRKGKHADIMFYFLGEKPDWTESKPDWEGQWGSCYFVD